MAIPVSCSGGSDGLVDVTVGGGATPYTYLWSNGATTEDLFGVAAGNYSLTITDGSGLSAVEPVLISQPNPITSTLNCINPTSSGASDGTSSITASGGVGLLGYNWNNGDTVSTVSGLSAGLISVTVTDANGCSVVDSCAINDPSGLLTMTSVPTRLTCSGDSSGSIDLTVSGGSQPYSFIWSNGSTTEDISGLSAGTYFVTIDDGLTSISSDSIFVTQPFVLNAQQYCYTPSFVGANDGVSVVHSVTGGNGGNTYLWSNGATTASITGLSPGVFDVTVTDALGCTDTNTCSVSNPIVGDNCLNTILICDTGTFDTPDMSSYHSSGTVPSCFGSGQNLTAGYRDVWFEFEVIQSGTVEFSVLPLNTGTGQNVNGWLDIALWDVTLSCPGTQEECIWTTGTGNTPRGIGMGQPNADFAPAYNAIEGQRLAIQITNFVNGTFGFDFTWGGTAQIGVGGAVDTLVEVSCFGDSDGQIDIRPAGGESPYTFNWSNGATTEDIANMVSGTHTVTVTDNRGCFGISAFTLTEPNNLADSITYSYFPEELCPGDEVTITAAGADQYEWVRENIIGDQLIIFIDTTTTYVVKSELGDCQVMDSLSVIVQSSIECVSDVVDVPNAFSPDGDGVNDLWIIDGIESTKNVVTIFNRWGDEIGAFVNYDNASSVWDGTSLNGQPLPTGTYFYVIKIDETAAERGWVQIVK